MEPIIRQNSISSIRSVERAFDLLEALERSRQPMRLTDLARLTGMPKATVQRLLGVLERRGMVDRAQGRYQIGVGVIPLAHGFLLENNLAQASLPVLQELARSSGETATLYVRLGLERVVVQRVEGKDPLRYSLPIGQRLPLLLGAAGLVLAAAMSEQDRRRLLEQAGEVRLGSGEVLSRKAVQARLVGVRKQGFAISRNERIVGTFSLAVPVVRSDGVTIAAVTVTGLCARISDERAAALSIEVRQAAQAIAARCGAGAQVG